ALARRFRRHGRIRLASIRRRFRAATRATATTATRGFLLLLARLGRFDVRSERGELEDRDRRRVAVADAELDDAGVAAGALREPRGDVAEELGHDGALLDVRQRAAAGREGTVLAERDHALGEAADLFRFGVG